MRSTLPPVIALSSLLAAVVVAVVVATPARGQCQIPVAVGGRPLLPGPGAPEIPTVTSAGAVTWTRSHGAACVGARLIRDAAHAPAPAELDVDAAPLAEVLHRGPLFIAWRVPSDAFPGEKIALTCDGSFLLIDVDDGPAPPDGRRARPIVDVTTAQVVTDEEVGCNDLDTFPQPPPPRARITRANIDVELAAAALPGDAPGAAALLDAWMLDPGADPPDDDDFSNDARATRAADAFTFVADARNILGLVTQFPGRHDFVLRTVDIKTAAASDVVRVSVDLPEAERLGCSNAHAPVSWAMLALLGALIRRRRRRI